MRRELSPLVAQRNEGLLQRIRALKAEHPCWDYRRIWTALRCIEQQAVNKTRSWRLMREHHRLVSPNGRLNAKRTPMRSKPKPTKPDEWWGIDMTKVLGEGFGGTSSWGSIGTAKRSWGTRLACDARPSNGWWPWTGRSIARALREPAGKG
jgi:hypothetical protein